MDHCVLEGGLDALFLDDLLVVAYVLFGELVLLEVVVELYNILSVEVLFVSEVPDDGEDSVGELGEHDDGDHDGDVAEEDFEGVSGRGDAVPAGPSCLHGPEVGVEVPDLPGEGGVEVGEV